MSTLAPAVHNNAAKAVDYKEKGPNSLTPAQLLTLLQQSEHVDEVFEKVNLDEASSNILQTPPLVTSNLDDTRLKPHEITQLTRAGTLKLLGDYFNVNPNTLPPTPVDNEHISFDSEGNYDDVLVKLLVKTAAIAEANRDSVGQVDHRKSSGQDRPSLSKTEQLYIEENTPLYAFIQNLESLPSTKDNPNTTTRPIRQRVRSSTETSDTNSQSALSGRSKNVSFKSKTSVFRASTLQTQTSDMGRLSADTSGTLAEPLIAEELSTEPGIILEEEEDDYGKPMTAKSALLWSLIFQELLDTERQYVQVLRSVLHFFISRMEKLDWVSYDQKSEISRNIYELVEFQDQFLQSLESSYQAHQLNDWNASGTSPAQCFLKLSRQFRVYIPYCSEHDSAQKALIELEKRAEWVSFTEECAADIQRESKTTRLPIQSYLMEPIQRICRYPLLLEKLMESTQKDTLAFREVLSARNLIRRIAREINEKKRQKEGREKAKILRNRLECVPGLSLEFVHSLGSIVIAGALLVANCQMQPPKVKYYGCVLFESYLLVIKAKKATAYEPKHWLPLYKIDIHDFNDDGNAWSISYLSKPVLEFQATCEREKQLWFQTLSKLISKSKRARHQANHPPALEQSPSSLSLCVRTEQRELLNQSKLNPQLESTLMREPSSSLNSGGKIQSLRTSVDIKLGDLFTQECVASRNLENAAMLKSDSGQTKRSVSAGAIIKPRNKSNRRKTWGHSLVHTNSVSNSAAGESNNPKSSNSFSIMKAEESKPTMIKASPEKGPLDRKGGVLSPDAPYLKKATEVTAMEDSEQFIVEHEFSLSRITAARSLKFRKMFWRGKINSDPDPKEAAWKGNPPRLETSLSDDSLHLYKDSNGGKMRGNFFGRMSEKLKPKQRSVNSAPDLKNCLAASLEMSDSLTNSRQTQCTSNLNSMDHGASKILAP
ncbi:hypothetical protein K493DRAFT_332505 [Basidiobolus meristosporus CBS 931.73]|uniref:DH domain-containing protein n=1 Tax=Basidiobolus meristosporus CBS 931.73 TaxID=1314790 RepID=A0A1Y1ZCN6_9FUNG|nr:hypothetical protein K493DRAFT_332505 [Basidiobolus meristosporus CBS 931.73]|eukprot:ORY07959.1 hypothetical protein K493DRAFT_332505 [Basidiobolus meristosporus CBS 931.73]